MRSQSYHTVVRGNLHRDHNHNHNGATFQTNFPSLSTVQKRLIQTVEIVSQAFVFILGLDSSLRQVLCLFNTVYLILELNPSCKYVFSAKGMYGKQVFDHQLVDRDNFTMSISLQLFLYQRTVTIQWNIDLP